ncbi:sensor histidine kinase [Couchioplanes caeruleus subsp. azureus]|uniref:sensor histidine kinase n=1 Tax=Couchioplanes caeruleus TaxID=56438 RepID=UPI0027E54196|nr:ATP-binding protein [Couchioplanes caeruleus]
MPCATCSTTRSSSLLRAAGSTIASTPRGGRAVVVVTDTGIGIPDGDLPGMFTPFHRGANAMDRAVQGSGLGLAIVRTIVTEHGGTVAVESKLDQGSTFTITLPLRPPPS